jgi:hypothetical protein
LDGSQTLNHTIITEETTTMTFKSRRRSVSIERPDTERETVSVHQPWCPIAPWMATTAWLEDLTNAELAVLLTQQILALLDMGTLPHDLVSEVIDRLEGRSPMPSRCEERIHP